MEWIKDRMKEPSSYAAAGVAVGGAVGFVLKEKGVI